jgi:uncharacterized protein
LIALAVQGTITPDFAVVSATDIQFKPNRQRAKAFLYTLAALLIIALLLPAMWSWFERKMLYVPSRSQNWTPGLSAWKFEDVWLTTQDGVRLHGWFLPNPASPGPARMAALILHGNGGNITHRMPLYAVLREQGLDVLAVDYRGYGQSRGTPSESGTYLDAEAAWQWLLGRGLAPGQTIVLGESLGGAVATELALRHPPAGLILQSTFTSIPDIARELTPWIPQRLIRTRYDTHAKLPKVQCPVLFLHGRADTLVHYSHAERNYAAAREPKWFRELEGDHNDPLAEPQGRERYAAAVREFLHILKAPLATGAISRSPTPHGQAR